MFFCLVNFFLRSFSLLHPARQVLLQLCDDCPVAVVVRYNYSSFNEAVITLLGETVLSVFNKNHKGISLTCSALLLDGSPVLPNTAIFSSHLLLTPPICRLIPITHLASSTEKSSAARLQICLDVIGLENRGLWDSGGRGRQRGLGGGK